MARINKPGAREPFLNRSGIITPRWSRYLDELAGLTANEGDVLVVGAGGAEYTASEATTLAQDIEFMEFWRT